MISLAWYLLKVIICSGILCGYYFLALRNKAFHRWNRFYLLAAIMISLLAPVIKINIFQSGEDKGTVVQMLQTINYGDEVVLEYSHNSGFQLTTKNMAEAAYILISVGFLCIFLISIYRIKRLRKKYPETKIEDISFINTGEKGTPFSFFKSIFWNRAIDLHSKSGQQIFNHEIAHIKEKHSYDKVFMNIVLIFFWINPFFWLMRKELYMIHEFIADKEAMEDSDINAFAEMILQTVYPGQHFSSTNSFFYSPIKRRILMLTKNKNPKVNYISRLLVLPLAAIVFFAFTFKIKNRNANLYDGKAITVVIDAGHGGTDNGAVAENGLKEKDITLSIAKKIALLNSNRHIKILLSRDNDQTISVKDRVVFAKNNNAALFISLHVNTAVNKQLNGFSVLIDKENSEKNLLLGSTLINEIKKSYQTEEKIGVRKNSIWVLDENVCPAALVECGFLSNSGDAAFISNSADQEKIAENILNAINNYASSNYPDNTATIDNNKTVSTDIIKVNDTIPPMPHEGEKAREKYDSGKNNATEMKTRNKDEDLTISADTIYIGKNSSPKPIVENLKLKGNTIYIDSKFPEGVLILADGKEISEAQMKNIPPNNIQSVDILKGETAIKKYGEKGKNGVIEVTTKEVHSLNLIDPNTKNPPIIFVDGKEISQNEMKNISGVDIQSITVLKNESAEKKYGDKGKNGVLEIITKKDKGFPAATDTVHFKSDPSLEPVPVNGKFNGDITFIKSKIPESALIFADGKEISTNEMKNIAPINIQSINVLKGDSAIEKYGKKGKNGVIEIILKSKS